MNVDRGHSRWTGMSALDMLRIDSPADIGPKSTLATRGLHHQTARRSLLGLFLQLIFMMHGGV